MAEAIAEDASGADEQALLQAWAAGDQRAFALLYSRYRKPLYGWLLRQVRSRADADDLFQDLWMNVVRKADSYKPGAGSVRTWLYSIGRNLVIDRSRRQQVRAVVAHDEEQVAAAQDQQADVDQVVARDQAALQLQALLAELPPGQRDALLLREQAGLAFAEVAGVLGISLEAARSRVRDAMRTLALALHRQRQADQEHGHE